MDNAHVIPIYRTALYICWG